MALLLFHRFRQQFCDYTSMSSPQSGRGDKVQPVRGDKVQPVRGDGFSQFSHYIPQTVDVQGYYT
jgi:hypothetical protein